MSENNNQDQGLNFDKIKNMITVGYPIIVIFGYYNLSSYYRKFGISIYNYVDFSEILLAFLHDITILIAFLILFNIGNILGYIIGALKINVNIKESKKISNSNQEKLKVSKFRRIITEIGIFLDTNYQLLVIITFSFLIIFHSRDEYADIERIGFNYLIIFIFSFGYILKNNITGNAKSILLSSIIIIGAFLFIKDKNYIRSDQILSKCNPELKNKLIYNNTYLKNDSTSIYIGETKKYLFTYNCKESTTTIFEKDDLN